MSDTSDVFNSLRKAIERAQVDTGGKLDFQRKTVAVAGITAEQLIVSYISGNEYLRLDRLIENLNEVGQVSLFEYRGRGMDEIPSFLVEVKIDNSTYQLIYLMEYLVP